MKILIIGFLLIQNVLAGYVVKKQGDDVVSVKKIKRKINNIKVVKSIQEFISERDFVKSKTYTEILYPDDLIPKNLINNYSSNKNTHWINSEIRHLINQGPFDNRINITILGDGYTIQEKEKFFSDTNRIVNDLFKAQTFKSYLALFNITAIFIPSNDSGITDLERKNTAFSLYRSPKGSKRGIIPGNISAIERALDLVSFYTHYPIIIANDDFYGGLGGRYAITTRSLTSGSMVLRHELGHNFSNVGEEYDGGQVYSGANFSRSKDIPWKHWIEDTLQISEAKFLTGAYIWQDLIDNDYIEYFTFSELDPHLFDIEISSVGWEGSSDVKVFLDGKELEIIGHYTSDRSFFKTKKVKITPGMHEIKIIDNSRDGNNVLAFANSKAYPLNYNFKANAIGAFNVFDSSQKQRGYRPTHMQCLMRDMRSKVFCPVDQENIWLQFLAQMDLIDEVQEISKSQFQVKTPDIQSLEIKWFQKKLFSKSEIIEFRNKTLVDLKNYSHGQYFVEVTIKNQEIRKTSMELSDSKSFKHK